MTNYITANGVQSFSITIASGAISGFAPISTVGSGAHIIDGGTNAATNGNPALDFARLTKPNSTTIAAQKNGATTGIVVRKGIIIDGDPTTLIKNIQTGTITVNGTGNATISAVANANTAIHSLSFTTADASANSDKLFCRLSLSGTTLTATAGNSGQTSIQGYEVIEYQTAALTANAVQQIAASNSVASTTWKASLTNINANNAISIFSGNTTKSSVLTMAVQMFRGALTNGTTFTVNSNTGEAVAKQYNASIPEFISGVFNQAIQRGTTSLSAATNNTSTLSNIVNTTYAGATFLGNTSTDATTNYSDALAAVALTANNTVTSSLQVAGTITDSWEVVEFTAFVIATSNSIWFGAIA